MENIRALILDMDGVLWRGSQPIGDLPSVFSTIRSKGLAVALATNNATLSVPDYLDKLDRFGVQLAAHQIVTSGLATAIYLQQRFPQGGPVYVIGEPALKETLRQAGFFPQEEGDVPLAVVVGKASEFNYDRLNQAMQYILGGALFIGTNPDKTYPMPGGKLVPGAGAVVAAVEAASGVEPMIIGKPSANLYRAALEVLGTPAHQTLVVGDRIETDIVGGQALGCPTALVLSGVTGEAQARAWNPPPDLITADLGQVVESL
jgi:4-nitrophenyl phosphatase